MTFVSESERTPGQRGLQSVAPCDFHELRLVGRARALDFEVDGQRLLERGQHVLCFQHAVDRALGLLDQSRIDRDDMVCERQRLLVQLIDRNDPLDHADLAGAHRRDTVLAGQDDLLCRLRADNPGQDHRHDAGAELQFGFAGKRRRSEAMVMSQASADSRAPRGTGRAPPRLSAAGSARTASPCRSPCAGSAATVRRRTADAPSAPSGRTRTRTHCPRRARSRRAELGLASIPSSAWPISSSIVWLSALARSGRFSVMRATLPIVSTMMVENAIASRDTAGRRRGTSFPRRG